MTQTFTKLKSFLKSPYHKESYENIRGKEFFFLLLITFAIVIPYAFILDLAGMDQFDHKLEFLLKKNKWLVAVLAIVIAPLLEEPIYRLHLDFKKSSIWWGLGLSLLLISEVWIPVALLWIWLFFLLYKVNKGEMPNLKYSIFISSVLFGLVHLMNFTDFDYAQYFYWVPFMVGAQCLIGLVLSYVRLNYGMKWGIIFHGVYNAILIIPAVYFYEV
ncbi:CAAX amino terminal protease [Rhodonellum psychrophilum GCM71 = DSM 17998]|uniref:CAAX amino terminal protease n=2 Tax=Rhodonellum TaxID=336827 RepID=U5C4Q2_9BACT|nr:MULTISPECIES: CPBP family intramembrane glutamic endopeptidase [Rhodonellum]ERM83192.1 CAAX amino terminal protease [Rhodonellum psychrophilum GCM71 = DSM 17998]SDZ14589.1 CAAX protease self-immunity [Rhodonellum ikkaensis]